MRLSRRAVLAMLLLLALAPAGHAGPFSGRRLSPLILEIDGVIAADRDAAAKIGFTTASFGVLGQPEDLRIWIGVNEARTVGRDTAVNGKDILDDMSAYQPNFLLAGSKAQVAQLTELPTGSAVRIQGAVDRGARTFLLRSVTLGTAE
jgi:hypothetical protein